MTDAELIAAIAEILDPWAREHYDDGADAAFDRNCGVDRSAEDIAREVLAIIRSAQP